MKKKITGVEGYISAGPDWARPTLHELRRVIRTTAPRAAESISYGVPYYALDGRLAYFSVHRAHCSFHWISNEDKRELTDALARARVVGNTLRMLRGENVPVTLVRAVVRAHAKRNHAASGRENKNRSG